MTLLLFALVIVALGAYSLGHTRGVALERSRWPQRRSDAFSEAARDERFVEAIRQRDEARRELERLNVWRDWVDEHTIAAITTWLGAVREQRDELIALAAKWPTQVECCDRTFTFCNETGLDFVIAKAEFEISLYRFEQRRAREADEDDEPIAMNPLSPDWQPGMMAHDGPIDRAAEVGR